MQARTTVWVGTTAQAIAPVAKTDNGQVRRRLTGLVKSLEGTLEVVRTGSDPGLLMEQALELALLGVMRAENAALKANAAVRS